MSADVFPLTPPIEAFFASAAWKARRALGDHPPATRRMALLEEALALAPTDPALPVPDQGWGRLAEVIRGDRPLGVDDPSFHLWLDAAGAEPARRLAERLIALGRTLVDLGGGLGTYARAFEALGGTALVIDRPEVVARAPAGLRARAADLFTVDESGFDLALLCNVLHLYGAADAARLCARARSMGRVVVVKDLDRATRAGVWFSLNMALFTDAGEVHPVESIAAWLGGDVALERVGDHVVVRTRAAAPASGL